MEISSQLEQLDLGLYRAAPDQVRAAIKADVSAFREIRPLLNEPNYKNAKVKYGLSESEMSAMGVGLLPFRRAALGFDGCELGDLLQLKLAHVFLDVTVVPNRPNTPGSLDVVSHNAHFKWAGDLEHITAAIWYANKDRLIDHIELLPHQALWMRYHWEIDDCSKPELIGRNFGELCDVISGHINTISVDGSPRRRLKPGVGRTEADTEDWFPEEPEPAGQDGDDTNDDGGRKRRRHQKWTFGKLGVDPGTPVYLRLDDGVRLDVGATIGPPGLLKICIDNYLFDFQDALRHVRATSPPGRPIEVTGASATGKWDLYVTENNGPFRSEYLSVNYLRTVISDGSVTPGTYKFGPR